MVVGNIFLVMLMAIGALPVRPFHTLAFGSSMFVTYVGAMALYPEKLYRSRCLAVKFGLPLCRDSLFVALTAIVYHQRASAFQARQQVLRAQAQVTLGQERGGARTARGSFEP